MMLHNNISIKNMKKEPIYDKKNNKKIFQNENRVQDTIKNN